MLHKPTPPHNPKHRAKNQNMITEMPTGRCQQPFTFTVTWDMRGRKQAQLYNEGIAGIKPWQAVKSLWLVFFLH